MDYFWTRMLMTSLLRMGVVKQKLFFEVRDRTLDKSHAKLHFTSDMDLDQAVYAMYSKDEYKGIDNWDFMHDR